ncbi:NYN domain-containing protein [Iningainema tapete]|uniref:NYN domain-containing protein n=1 Tax=Iningainema tapete BLCC-T55 TaxID=2748662 RepID=A0A8J6XLW7_9CYAN|nr:NYN domain-containing protein [Iningainema tapete]MBD2774079.1 hypothetical protein [Iningainema tapete BLCC-T55]
MNNLLTTYDSALLNQISSHVCQAMIVIQQQQRELLLEKYRNVDWRSEHYQSSLTNKLTEVLSSTQDWEALVQQLQRFLTVLIPESSESEILIGLLEKIRQLNPRKPEINSSVIVDNLKSIAILLLDAENLQINTETEKFLTKVCTCPIQVKIAFANWRSLGKLDVDFHRRGYELIHVPAGKDNADGKMIAFGSSIHEYYPKAKEVLVCSSDTVMTNLCNHLQKNGLIVYRVSKQGQNLKILNSHSEMPTHFLFNPPSIKKFISEIKSIMKAEETRTANQWIKLSQISNIYYKNTSFSLDEVVSFHLPGKTIKDIFINEHEIAVHHLPEDTETYVALFKMHQVKETENNSSVQKQEINTKADLEQVIVKIISELASKNTNSYIPLENISSKFNQKYGEGITKLLKKLGLNRNLQTFLASECSSFQLQKTGAGTTVALKTA